MPEVKVSSKEENQCLEKRENNLNLSSITLFFFGIFCHKSFKPIQAIQLYLAEGV